MVASYASLISRDFKFIMTENFKPETPEQVLELVNWAAADGHVFDVSGSSSKKAYGRSSETANGLSLSAFAGITLYEPEELVMAMGAGTPIAEIHAALQEKNQHLAFEPMDLGPLLGGSPNGGTIGGALACNLSGPRRIKLGAARDHLLGFKAISGRGEHFKSGGRVVKNVTGFDLSKLMTGSMGTLGVLTAVTLKVLPAPERTRTVLIMGDDTSTAVQAMTAALQSPHEVSAAAHIPAALAARSEVSYIAGAGTGVMAIRVEGPGPSADVRCEKLRDLLAGFGEIQELHSMNSAKFWREVRDVKFFTNDASSEKQIWRISVPPASGADVAATIMGALGGEVYFDWGGGLIWLALDRREDAGHEIIRGALKDGGHATLIRAADAVRANTPVFHLQPGPLAEITKRTKTAFDPKGVLNPGRMYEGV
jgi:glycolate oxidase FAD binding subunit